MNNEFKEGDIVQLKSGGPYMTVISTYEDSVYCVYFNLNLNKYTETFSRYCLNKIEK